MVPQDVLRGLQTRPRGSTRDKARLDDHRLLPLAGPRAWPATVAGTLCRRLRAGLCLPAHSAGRPHQDPVLPTPLLPPHADPAAGRPSRAQRPLIAAGATPTPAPSREQRQRPQRPLAQLGRQSKARRHWRKDDRRAWTLQSPASSTANLGACGGSVSVRLPCPPGPAPRVGLSPLPLGAPPHAGEGAAAALALGPLPPGCLPVPCGPRVAHSSVPCASTREDGALEPPHWAGRTEG